MVHVLIAHSKKVPCSVHNAPAWIQSDRAILEQDWHHRQACREGPLCKGEEAMPVLGGAFRCHNEQGIPAKHSRDRRLHDFHMLPCTIHKRGCSTISTGMIANGGYMQRMLHEMTVNYTGTVPHNRGNFCSSHRQ